jgi:hypothetical protein
MSACDPFQTFALDAAHQQTRRVRVNSAKVSDWYACQFFYMCTGCGTKLRPQSGDCCVFCFYGSVPCPPMQSENATSCCTTWPPPKYPAIGWQARLAAY